MNFISPCHYNYLDSQKSLASLTLDICRTYKILAVLWCRHHWIAWYIKKDGSPDSDLDFLWSSGQSRKGVGAARVSALNHCSNAKWSRVAKWVNILLDYFQSSGLLWRTYSVHTRKMTMYKDIYLTRFLGSLPNRLCDRLPSW